MDVFNEERLHQEISSIWGEYGAHAEVYRDVLAQREALVEVATNLVEAFNHQGSSLIQELVATKHAAISALGLKIEPVAAAEVSVCDLCKEVDTDEDPCECFICSGCSERTLDSDTKSIPHCESLMCADCAEKALAYPAHDPTWNDDRIQFARLLSELRENTSPDPPMNFRLCRDMAMEGDEVGDLFDKADKIWTQAKDEIWEMAPQSHTTSDGYTFKRIDGKWTDWDMTFDSIEQMEDEDGVTATEDPVQQEQQS